MNELNKLRRIASFLSRKCKLNSPAKKQVTKFEEVSLKYLYKHNLTWPQFLSAVCGFL